MATVKTVYEDVYIYSCNTQGADLPAASYPASGSFINVSDFEWCAFIVTAGALDTALTVTVQQAATVSGALKDLTNTRLWVIGTGDDDKTGIIEFSPRELDLNNGYNYVTMTASGSSGDDTAHILFLGFGNGKPVTQSSTQFDTSSIGVG